MWFCSLHRPPPNHLRQVIDWLEPHYQSYEYYMLYKNILTYSLYHSSIVAHNMLLGRSTAKAKCLVWCSLQV